ncbi:MAG: sigma-70 family RNA polymerase sigma factor [Acidobacteriota bacterium]
MEQILETTLPKARAGPLTPTESLEENLWVAASQRGDALAFNRLVLKWERPVFNLALRMLQNGDEAADATQEVFLCAFKNIRGFRRESRFSTWLYRIAANQCISRLRRRPVGPHYSLDDPDSEGWAAREIAASDSQEAHFLQAENRSRVRRALECLPPEQRLAVELKFYQDLTFEEIAAIVEAPLSTVKSRLYAGLELLKTHLGRAKRSMP